MGSRLQELLFRPISIASLACFRIIFGLLGFIDILSSWLYYHRIVDAYSPDRIRFPYMGFEWLPTFYDPWMSLIFIVILIAALGIIFGQWYRLSTTVFAFGFLYIFLLEKAHYLNHGYLFCWLSFVMIFLPADRAFSLRVWQRPSLYSSQIPFWVLLPLPLMMGIVYFFGGIAKMNPEWLTAIPLKIWLGRKGDLPLIGSIVTQAWVPYFMAIGGFLLDLLVVFFLLNKRTRIWAFSAVLFFHIVNHLIFDIGIFPFLSVALTALYFSPDIPLRFLNWLRKKSRFMAFLVKKWEARMQKGTARREALWQLNPIYFKQVLSVFIIFLFIHISLPLRHHLYPGDVAWTEEGHKYSWRMMLRTKSGRGHFTIVHSDGKREDIDLKDYLYARQRRKVLTRPDLMIQFAHQLRDQYRARGEEVEVYAKIKVKLNARPRRTIVDPAVDLAKENWSFFQASDWILPYEY